MLKTLSRFTSSFAALLAEKATVIDADGRCEDIRNAMLEALSALGGHQGQGGGRVWGEITHASDVQTLWYLRSDVLRLLADAHGEQLAWTRLDAITEMFRGLVPKNQMPGPRRAERPSAKR